MFALHCGFLRDFLKRILAMQYVGDMTEFQMLFSKGDLFEQKILWPNELPTTASVVHDWFCRFRYFSLGPDIIDTQYKKVHLVERVLLRVHKADITPG